MEMDWLREMMRISGVPEESEEEEALPFLPGMLPQSDEEEAEAERRYRFCLAEQQTLALIEEQEALRDGIAPEEE
ncbi:MAG: hypothetical protein Q4F79_10925 [Eubacteriales bacterium]|nr:hypothetical protein [Eubacteriales bacterium]